MRRIYLMIICCILSCYSGLQAQDRIFNYIYQSGVLSGGERELEIWTTYHSGRESYYRGLDARAEFEMGLARHLQTAFYLNYSSKATEVSADTISVLEKENPFSFSNEWKFKLSDASASSIGSALYGELTVGTTDIELEARVILDKQIGRITQAFNLIFEPEWEWKAASAEVAAKTEYKFELCYGLGVHMGKGWSLGAEIRNPNVVADNKWSNCAIYAGPVISYASGAFWINLTLMPQVAGLRGKTPGTGLNLDEFERYQVRLLFSYSI